MPVIVWSELSVDIAIPHEAYPYVFHMVVAGVVGRVSYARDKKAVNAAITTRIFRLFMRNG